MRGFKAVFGTGGDRTHNDRCKPGGAFLKSDTGP